MYPSTDINSEDQLGGAKCARGGEELVAEQRLETDVLGRYRPHEEQRPPSRHAAALSGGRISDPHAQLTGASQI